MARAVIPSQFGASTQTFRRRLLAWYDRHRRPLPWRRDHDPYRVWISEIMLQQTRVAAVIEHYERFLRRFPAIQALARARQDSVLATWTGLGYYRRARLLHAAAKKICSKYNGQFPTDISQLHELPGIGRYTAAAIASIAFSQPVAAIDGNVERVMNRLLGRQLTPAEVSQVSQHLLSRARPGDFNQAMMELGATVCMPRRQLCPQCPLNFCCATYKGAIQPLRAVKQSPARQKREIYYALARRNGSVFLIRRDDNASLMPGQWELPRMNHLDGQARNWLSLRHSITVTDYLVRVAPVDELPTELEGRWVKSSRLTCLPLTGLANKILRAARII